MSKVDRSMFFISDPVDSGFTESSLLGVVSALNPREIVIWKKN